MMKKSTSISLIGDAFWVFTSRQDRALVRTGHRAVSGGLQALGESFLSLFFFFLLGFPHLPWRNLTLERGGREGRVVWSSRRC